jgi:hypothetical protein
MTLSLSLALLGALCGGFRDVENANGERGANAESTKNLPSGPTCHDSSLWARNSSDCGTVIPRLTAV